MDLVLKSLKSQKSHTSQPIFAGKKSLILKYHAKPFLSCLSLGLIFTTLSQKLTSVFQVPATPMSLLYFSDFWKISSSIINLAAMLK